MIICYDATGDEANKHNRHRCNVTHRAMRRLYVYRVAQKTGTLCFQRLN